MTVDSLPLLMDVRARVSDLREMGSKPRMHPNGFIQIDIDLDGEERIAKRRLHVWPDDDSLPRQETVNTIHDHKFDMMSEVIKGKIIQRRYFVHLEHQGNPTHEIYVAEYGCKHESILRKSGVKIHVKKGIVTEIVAGSIYHQPMTTFHDTHWEGLTATIMTKEVEDRDHDPMVLCPIGQEPDNSFLRSTASEDRMWWMIDRALS